MVLSSDELDRIADDIYKDRIITGSVYCGNCGYNLRTLPYVYTCPECGNGYNARPLKMEGIFAPQDTYFPASDIAATLLCAAIMFVFVRGNILTPDFGRLFSGGVFGVLGLFFASQAYHRLVRFFRARETAKRIVAEEG